MDWLMGNKKNPSGFSSSSTAEEVTQGIDGTGLVAIVTGTTKGIGVEIARVLALRQVHVYMAVRNVEAGNNVKLEILKDNPSAKVDVMKLDLASLESIRKFVSEFLSLNQPLNILINNAAVSNCPFSLSTDGIELQVATNYIGPFLLTNLLLEKMKSTAQQSNVEGKIVLVSSMMHRMPYKGGIQFDKINDESSYSKSSAYGQSKLATILHAKELSRRLKEEGVLIAVNAVHPGAVNTDQAKSFLGPMSGLGKYIFKNVQQGAATSCYLALHPDVHGVSGKYFAELKEVTPSSLATDPELAKKLWDFSMELVQ